MQTLKRQKAVAREPNGDSYLAGNISSYERQHFCALILHNMKNKKLDSSNCENASYKNTRMALSSMQQLLVCCQCSQLKRSLCTLGNCDHLFCVQCVQDYRGRCCPVCGILAHSRDAQVDKQLSTLASLSLELDRLLQQPSASVASDDGLHDTVNTSKADRVVAFASQIESHDSDSQPSLTSPLQQDVADDSNLIKSCSASAENKQNINQKRRGRNAHPTEKDAAQVMTIEKRVKATLDAKIKAAAQKASEEANDRCPVDRKRASKDSVNFTEIKTRQRRNGRDKQTKAAETTFEEDDNQESFQTTLTQYFHGETSVNTCTSLLKGECNKTPGTFDASNDIKGCSKTARSRKSVTTNKEQNLKGDSAMSVCLRARCASSSPGGQSGIRKNKQQRKSYPPTSAQISSDVEASLTREEEDQKVSLLEDNHKRCMSGSVRKSRECSGQKHNRGSIPGDEPLAIPLQEKPQNPFTKLPVTPSVRKLNQQSFAMSPGSAGRMKRNAKGETPLHVACIKGDVQIVEELLKQGHNPNVRDNAGWTPLHEAVNHGNSRIAQMLLRHGAAVNMPGLDNDTPLHDAVTNNRIDCIPLLLAFGASKTARNIHGKTAIDLAHTDKIRAALDHPITQQQVPVNIQEHEDMIELMPLCFLGTALDRDQRILLQKCATKLHAKVVDEFSPEVTHVISSCNKDGQCPRTLKYLQAVLGGRWIVAFDWIKICLEYGKKVLEEAFEIPGSSTHPNCHAAHLARLNRKQQLPGLFDGCQVYLHGTFTNIPPSRQELSDLLRQGGAQLLTRQPHMLDLDKYETTVPYHAALDSRLADCGIFIVHDGSGNAPKLESCRARSMPASWVIECIATFSLVEPPTSP